MCSHVSKVYAEFWTCTGERPLKMTQFKRPQPVYPYSIPARAPTRAQTFLQGEKTLVYILMIHP